MRIWHLLPVISAPMPFQMALDEILFRRMEEQINSSPSDAQKAQPIIRFYYTSEPWITVGYSYRNGHSKDWDSTIPVCKRLTGGGVVEHGKDLIFSMIAAKKHDDSFSSVRVSYLKIHEAIKSALESQGKTPRFYRCDESLPKGEDCFRYPIATDLALDEQKIAGGAQKRSSGVFLHQESLFWPGLKAGHQTTDLLIRGFEGVFQVDIQSEDWDPDLFQKAEALAEERYSVSV